ncbi:MAG: dCTP deaminase [Candidatus Acetothermia bacterium]
MLLEGEEAKEYVDGIIHEETQVSDRGVDLTVDEVVTAESPTDLDFGGGEEKIGKTKELSPVKRNEGDDYGWWNLEGGLYIIGFNEEIEVSDGTGIIVPLPRLTGGGSFHAPVVFTGKLENGIILQANPAGLNLKENARISRLLVRR